MIIVRIDPKTNTVSWDEPSSDTMTFQAPTFREAINQAAIALQMFGNIMDEQGIKNFDLSKP